MASEKDLEKQVGMYSDLAKQDPNIDVGMLMLNALKNENQNTVSAKSKHWAYLISIGVPPFGLIFALNYFFSDKDDARQVAWTCVVLTIISIILFFVTMKLFFSGTGASIDQIKNIKTNDIMQLTQ